MEGLGWAHFGLGTALSTPPLTFRAGQSYSCAFFQERRERSPPFLALKSRGHRISPRAVHRPHHVSLKTGLKPCLTKGLQQSAGWGTGRKENPRAREAEQCWRAESSSRCLPSSAAACTDGATKPGVPTLGRNHLNTGAESAPSALRVCPKVPSRLPRCCKPSDAPSNRLCWRATSASGAPQMLPNPNAEAKRLSSSFTPSRQCGLGLLALCPQSPRGSHVAPRSASQTHPALGGGVSPLSAAAHRCCAHRQPPGLLHQTDTTARKRGTRRGGRRAAGRACSPRPPNTNITFGSSEDSAGPRFHFCLEQGRSQGLCCAPGMRMQLGGLPGGG